MGASALRPEVSTSEGVFAGMLTVGEAGASEQPPPIWLKIEAAVVLDAAATAIAHSMGKSVFSGMATAAKAAASKHYH